MYVLMLVFCRIGVNPNQTMGVGVGRGHTGFFLWSAASLESRASPEKANERGGWGGGGGGEVVRSTPTLFFFSFLKIWVNFPDTG